MNSLVPNLATGGIMTNYDCSVKCAHCRHNASPSRNGGFITTEMLTKIISKLEKPIKARDLHYYLKNINIDSDTKMDIAVNEIKRYEQTPTPSQPINITNKLLPITSVIMKKTNRFKYAKNLCIFSSSCI